MFFCGNLNSPCRSIRYAVKISKNNDKILIAADQQKPYKECSNTSYASIELNKSLSFLGINGTAVIECRPGCDLFKIRNPSDKTRVIFSDLVMSRSNTVVQCLKANVELIFERCSFEICDIGVNIRESMRCSIQTIDSSFKETRNWAISARCVNLTARFTNTSFYASPVNLQAFSANDNSYQTNQVYIFNCVFDGQRKRLEHNLLAINIYAVIVNVTVHSSVFANHYALSTNMLPVFLVYDNSYRKMKQKETFISLNKLLVENNHSPFSGISVLSIFNRNRKKPFKLKLSNSIFRNNSGALKVNIQKDSSRSIDIRGPAMQITNNTFVKNLNGYAAKSAIFLVEGRISLTSCRFLDNLVVNYPYASVITSAIDAVTIFKNCYFENTQTDSSSILVFGQANSRLWFKANNTFNIVEWKSGQTIFLHMPSTKKPGVRLDQGSFRMICPQGFELTSKCQRFDVKNTIDCSYLITSCHQCPSKTYSLERGELYANMSQRKVHCRNCPRGALCEEGRVTAKSNFWGYENKGQVSFLSCPPNYCCAKKYCQRYNSCHGNRTGTLCGECPDGMSVPLFTTKCKANSECTSIIFWPGALCLFILYLLFFLYHEEITHFIRKSLSLKLPCRKLPLMSKIEHTNCQSSNKTRSSGFLKILFYYYQTIQLFRNSVVTRRRKKILVKLENTFSRTINLIVINIPSFGCPFQNLQAIGKTVILHSVGYCLLALTGLLLIITKVFTIEKKCVTINESTQATPLEPFQTGNNQTKGPKSRFTVRIASTFTYVSLLMYSSSAELCLSLLNCVSVGDDRVLFIDGTIKCYQTFQYFLVGYVAFSILPFCLVPVLGSYLLKLGRISVFQFCIACIFPLPFCCFWMYLLLKNCPLRYNSVDNTNISEETPSSFCNNTDQETCSETQHSSGEATSSTAAILGILLGPFRAHEPVFCFPASRLPWEGFLIFRRLVLIIVLTSVYDNRPKMIIALIICVAILIFHMHVKPFISSCENFIETLSLGTLVVFSAFTLVKALYQGEDFSSSAHSSTLLSRFDLVQDILAITPFTIIIILVTLSLLIRFIFGLQLCIRVCLRFLARLCKG